MAQMDGKVVCVELNIEEVHVRSKSKKPLILVDKNMDVEDGEMDIDDE